jgi:hypothetical protein
MPQIPNLINLAIPGFIALLLLEVVLDAVMRRDLYQFKDTAASLTMGTGSIVLSGQQGADVCGLYRSPSLRYLQHWISMVGVDNFVFC